MASKAAPSSAAPTRAVFRSAEDLYTQLPVRDVIRVLAKTREDAEKKREELRDLVGRRYHDLIDSADAIISMNDTVVGFEKTLLTIEAAANMLLNDVAPSSKSEALGSPRKRKQGDAQASTSAENVMNVSSDALDGSDSPSILTQTEAAKIELILRGPTEMWSALDEGNELKAAKLYLQTREVADQLRLLHKSSANGDLADDDALRVLAAARRDLKISDEMVESCRSLMRKAQDERDISGEWQLKFPFLVSQARLLADCRSDIVRTCSMCFAERQISASRVERVMEALLLLGEISNPMTALLEARSQALQACADAGEDDVVFAVAELASRTVRDCAWMKARFAKDGSMSDVLLTQFIENTAAPLAKTLADTLCAKTSTVAALAALQRSLKDSIKKVDANPSQESTSTIPVFDDETLFARLFGASFKDRAAFLLGSSHDVTLRKVKRLLQTCGNAVDHKRNDFAFRAFSVLEKGLKTVERDAAELGGGSTHEIAVNKAWLDDLLAWLEQRPTPVNGRFSQLLMGFLIPSSKEAGGSELRARLETLSNSINLAWAEAVVKRLGAELETRAAHLPWSKEGRAGSSAVGGWTKDPTHGDLPNVASWPAAEFCFALARELDGFTDVSHRGGPICAESDARVRKLLGDLAWRRAHANYSVFAKDATGADGKLQAAFDLEFCAVALLDASRPPLPFTNGGVDVFASADALRARAKVYAASSRLLHSNWMVKTSPAETVHEIKVGAHNLLTLVEPVPRFALLPVPQKRSTSPRLLHRSSSQTSDSYADTPVSTTTSAKSSAASAASAGLGRVLGWLS